MENVFGILIMLFIAIGIMDIYVDFKLKKMHLKLDRIEQLCNAISKEQAHKKSIG